jgi:hypothetical protein
MRGAFVTVPLLVRPGLALLMVVRMSEDRLTPTPGMQGRDEREGPITLDELGQQQRDGFANVLRVLNSLDRRVGTVEERLEDVESHVYSDPPPPVGVRRARLVRRRSPSLPERTSEQAGDIAELSGRVLTLESKADTTIAINKQQSKAMGLAMPDASFWRKAFAFLGSRKGAEFVLTIATLLASIAGLERATDAAQRAQDALRHLPAGEVAPR